MLLFRRLLATEQYDLGEVGDVLLLLVGFGDIDVVPILGEFIDADCFFPPAIFYRAPSPISLRLVERIQSGTLVMDLSDALSGLAWVGDDVAFHHFKKWIQETPGWFQPIAAMGYSISQFCREGGWEVQASGERRDIAVETCFALDYAPADEESSGQRGGGEIAGLPTDLRCTACDRELVSLLRWKDGDFPELEQGGLPSAVDALTCLHCVQELFTVFSKRKPDGSLLWHRTWVPNPDGIEVPEVEASESEQSALPLRRLRLAAARSPRCALSEVSPVELSQVGGLPTWIHDPQYASCPDCESTMRFIGQVTLKAMEASEEGVVYGLWCDDCLVTATSFQMG